MKKMTQENSKSKKSKTSFLILGIIVLLIIVVALIYFYFQKSGNKSDEYLDLGLSYLEKEEYTKAASAFNDSIKANGESEEAYKYLAQAATLAHDYTLAHSAYEQLAILSENSYASKLAEADLYLAEGKQEEADILINKLKEDNSNDDELEYYLNLYSNALQINNENNYSNFAYDYFGNVYFTVPSNFNTDERFKIYKYNINNPIPKLIVDEDILNYSSTIAVWNNRIYINNQEGVYSYNIYGTDAKLEVEDFSFQYASQGKLYESINAIRAGSISEFNIADASLSFYDVDPKKKLEEWIPYDGSVYYLDKADTDTGPIELMKFNLSTSELSSLGSWETGEGTYINGLYCYNNNLFLNFYYDDMNVISAENKFIKFDLDTRQSEELEFSNQLIKASDGFNVDDQYYYLGSNTTIIKVYDKESLNFIKSIDVKDIKSYSLENLETGSTTFVKGVTVIPKYIILNPRLIKPNSGYSYYVDIYQINIDTWKSSELYTNYE